jgi:HSP20 family protein
MSDLIVRNQPDVEVSAQQRSGVTYTPRFDLWENDDAFFLSGDLPGVTPENLDVQYENQELKIWGKVAPRQRNVGYWAQEYGVGDYYRSFTLGEMIDAEGIEAGIKDGVLTITLPKKAEARPRRIAVKTG